MKRVNCLLLVIICLFFFCNSESLATDRISTVIVIDNSASMQSNDSNGLRGNAAKLFVDLSQVNDEVAVVGFSNDSLTQVPLTKILGTTTKSSIKNSISVSPEGGTNYQPALSSAADLLSGASSRNNRRAVIFFTDGEPSDNPTLPSEYSANGWRVFPVGFGNADETVLFSMAAASGGEYRMVSNVADIQPAMVEIATLIRGSAPPDIISDSITGDQEKTYTFNISKLAEWVEFWAIWDAGKDISFWIEKPNGQIIDESSSNYTEEGTYGIYRIESPTLGSWTVHIKGNEPESVVINYSYGPLIEYVPVGNIRVESIPTNATVYISGIPKGTGDNKQNLLRYHRRQPSSKN